MKSIKEIKSNKASEKGLDTSRRRAVLGTLAGATAVTAWHKPVITSVMLPAHAQTSPATMALTFFASGAIATPIMVKSSPVDWLMPSAVASEVPITSEYSVSIQQTAPETDNYQIDLFERRLQGMDNVGEFLYSGTASEAAGGTLNVIENPCEIRTLNLSVEIASISETSVTLNISTLEVSLEIPAGAGALPTPMCDTPELPESFFSAEASAISLLTSSGQPSVLDMLIPTANAGGAPQGTFGFSAAKRSETSYVVAMINVDGNVLRRGTLTIGVQSNLVYSELESCVEEGNPRDIPTTIQSVDQSFMRLDLQTDNRGIISFSIPAGPGIVSTNCPD